MLIERFQNHKNKESVNIPAKPFVWRPGVRARFCMTLVAMSVLYLGVLPARAQEQMAKEAQNRSPA